MRHLPLFLILIVPLALFFASSADGAEPIQIGEHGSIFSQILDEERPLMVSLPPGYATSKADYPVLYLLDARTNFHHTTGTLNALARLGHAPEMIVVGIINTNRTRDLTPIWTDEETIADQEDRAQMVSAGGGADAFLRFLGEELIPHIDATFRAAPFRILVGHSFGGLFAVHAFHTEPGLFDATLAISPSLWWDTGQAIDEIRTLFKENPKIQHHLYLTLGNEGGIMLDPFRRLQSTLLYEAPDTLSWHAEVYDHEDHGTMPIPSTYTALRFFFPRWQVPNHIMDEGLDAVDAHYASLSDTYGYRIETAESMINNLGYRALGSDDIEEAMAVFQENVDRFPGSSNVYDSLGEAVEASGDLDKALELYKKALEIGEKAGGDPNLTAYQAHIDAVTEKLK